MKTGRKAWVGQRKADVKKRGKGKAPWLVFWSEPGGRRREKSCGPGRDGRLLAQREALSLPDEIVSGPYGRPQGGLWPDFWRRDAAPPAWPRVTHAPASLLVAPRPRAAAAPLSYQSPRWSSSLNFVTSAAMATRS